MAEVNTQTWTYEDAAVAREFFNSSVGSKLKMFLNSSVRFVDADNIEEEALNARSSKGMLAMLTMLDNFINYQMSQEPENVSFINPSDH